MDLPAQASLASDVSVAAGAGLAPDVGSAAGVDLASDVGLAAGVDLAPDVGLAAGAGLAPDVGLAAGVDLVPGVEFAADAGVASDVSLVAGVDPGADVGLGAGAGLGTDVGSPMTVAGGVGWADDGSDVVSSDMAPPTLDALTTVVEHHRDIQPQEMPSVEVPPGEYGKGAWAPQDVGPDGPQGEIDPGRPGRSA
ncbi:hypothetical protein ACFQYP_40075 [Nonomuraea antimicrobica]